MDQANPGGPVGISKDAQRWFDDQSAIELYCESRPETFAGRWMEGGGTSEVLAFTDDARQHAAELRSLLNDSTRVSVVRLPNTYQSLLELRDVIPGFLGTTEGLAAWGPDVKANCVVVRALPGHVERVRVALTALNPDIRVEQGERPVLT